MSAKGEGEQDQDKNASSYLKQIGKKKHNSEENSCQVFVEEQPDCDVVE